MAESPSIVSGRVVEKRMNCFPSPGFAGEGLGVRVFSCWKTNSRPHPRPLSRKAGRGGRIFHRILERPEAALHVVGVRLVVGHRGLEPACPSSRAVCRRVGDVALTGTS